MKHRAKRKKHKPKGHHRKSSGKHHRKPPPYAHILDEDRKVNAMKFETSFYNIRAALRNVQAPQEEQAALDVSTLIEQLQKSPELLQTLSQLIAAKN